jgi:hypothetical protein
MRPDLVPNEPPDFPSAATQPEGAIFIKSEEGSNPEIWRQRQLESEWEQMKDLRWTSTGIIDISPTPSSPWTETKTAQQAAVGLQSCEDSGEYSRKAFAEGAEAIAQYDKTARQMTKKWRPCPKLYASDAIPWGYRCKGGTHYIPDKEIDEYIRSEGKHKPQIYEIHSKGWDKGAWFVPVSPRGKFGNIGGIYKGILGRMVRR